MGDMIITFPLISELYLIWKNPLKIVHGNIDFLQLKESFYKNTLINYLHKLMK